MDRKSGIHFALMDFSFIFRPAGNWIGIIWRLNEVVRIPGGVSLLNVVCAFAFADCDEAAVGCFDDE